MMCKVLPFCLAWAALLRNSAQRQRTAPQGVPAQRFPETQSPQNKSRLGSCSAGQAGAAAANKALGRREQGAERKKRRFACLFIGLQTGRSGLSFAPRGLQDPDHDYQEGPGSPGIRF